MSLGIDEGLYPFGKPLVQSSEIALEFVRMIALGLCLECLLDHDLFGRMQQAENGIGNPL